MQQKYNKFNNLKVKQKKIILIKLINIIFNIFKKMNSKDRRKEQRDLNLELNLNRSRYSKQSKRLS